MTQRDASGRVKRRPKLHKSVVIAHRRGFDDLRAVYNQSFRAMAATRPIPLLICSIGNPGVTYKDTLHSAGHTALTRLAEQLGYSGFYKSQAHSNGFVSVPLNSNGDASWTLWQSPLYMNESGRAVRNAFRSWKKTLSDNEGRLVIVHDELEKPLGAVSVKTDPKLSAKGHNGLKSIMDQLGGGTAFVRIGVGIGRPESRLSDDVARYVLRKMSPAEKKAIEGATDKIIARLRELERSP